jgi:DNA-binding response OmpR family regulator
VQKRNAETSPSHVLIINDDDALQAQLESVVRKSGMIVETASTRAAAHALAKSEALHDISSAIIVDGVDGWPALEYAAMLLQHDRFLSCILILLEHDTGTLLRALRLRVCDALTQPLDEGELSRALIKAITLNKHKRAALVTKMQTRDVTKIHRRLLTGREFSFKDFRPDYRKRMESAFFPAFTAGGDFGRCLRLDDQRLLIIYGDTSGHDIKSGFISAYFLGLNRGMLMLKTEPQKIFEAFNQFLINTWNKGRDDDEVITSIGVCFIILDFEKKEISCSCNGVPSPILCDDNLDVVLLGEKSQPLGWFDEPIAPTRIFKMPENGCIVTFTDGLFDLGDGSLCMLGMADVILGIAPDSSASNSLFERQRDDVFAQRFAWAKDASTHARIIRPICNHAFKITDIGSIDALQDKWEKTLRTVLPGLPKNKRVEILLCCREAVINAVEHGGRCSGESECRFTMACYGPQNLHIRISGRAAGSDGSCACNPFNKPDTHIPFGMKIIHGYADSFVYDEKNNSLLLDFNLTSVAYTRKYQTDGDNNETLMLLP